MSNIYSFEFNGTKEMFLNNLNKFPNNDQKFFYFDDYIVELANNEIRFGVARGGHSGGFWFTPTITEIHNKTIFCGEIKHIDSNTTEQGIKKALNKFCEFMLIIVFMPVFIVAKLYYFLKKSKTEEPSIEDKLYNLMENHLNCTRK